ncbi:MAG TPA: hypothetical protein VGJ91_22835 [Polyangiaceae bacterium]
MTIGAAQRKEIVLCASGLFPSASGSPRWRSRSVSSEKYGFAELIADFPVIRSAWPAYIVC